MESSTLKPAPVPEIKEIAPEDIIANVQSNIYELFIRTDENGNPPLDSIDRAAIKLFGLQNAFLLEITGNGTTIADNLEPEYKNALVDAALNAEYFETFLDDWICSDGTNEINLFREIKTRSLGYISDDETKDVRDDTDGHGFIYTYEFLHYLGFTDSKDTEIRDNLRDNVYGSIIERLDRNRFSSIDSFLRSSVDINFTEEQIDNIKEKYIQKLINSIDRRGFEKDYSSSICIMERKLGKIGHTKKEKIYRAAISHLSKDLRSEDYNNYIRQFENILDYFERPPKEPKKQLIQCISGILLENFLTASEATTLQSAQRLYRRIDGHNKKTESCFFTGKIVKSKKMYETTTDVRTEMERLIMNEMEDMTDDIFSELINLYDQIFNKDDLKDRVVTEVIDSVSRKEERLSKNLVERYSFNWKEIETKMKEVRKVYPDINFSGRETYEGNDFRKSARTRILDEAGKGIVSGLNFWNNILNNEEDISNPFKDLYRQWYGSEYAKQLMNSYDFRNHLLKTARDYKTVFGDYPDEFYKGFQDKAVNCLDSLIEEADKNEGVFDKYRAKSLKWFLLDYLMPDELYLLTALHEKITYINKNYPQISETAISEQFQSC
ncbi:MAG: hypothetical protein U9R43_11630 [Thermodesulfobacteriota bacterium]|nr:hypothetical protein [Thermodesulfobacteriota bacterium]